MLAICFFTVIFSSLLWLIYALRFINDSLAGISFFDAGATNVLLYTLLVCVPIFLIWSIFAAVNQYLNNRNVNLQLRKLMSQMKKNQDYSDLTARVLIETEGHIRDGFVLNKFDLLIADMNELLSEIIRNCKIASSEQIENLWNRVQNGGKWAFGKVVIEVSNTQPNFKTKVYERASADAILGGTILEFCARYLAVVKMLEKHDTDKIFLNMIENGVIGKVFSIFAPIADELRRVRTAAQNFAENENKEESRPVLRPTLSEEKPSDSEPLRAVREPMAAATPVEKKSFFNKLSSFGRIKTEPTIEPVFSNERDAFSIALEKSFGNEEVSPPTAEDVSLSNPQIVAEPHITDTQKTLDDLKKEWAEAEVTPPVIEKSQEKEMEENFTYPFGGWADEKNYTRR